MLARMPNFFTAPEQSRASTNGARITDAVTQPPNWRILIVRLLGFTAKALFVFPCSAVVGLLLHMDYVHYAPLFTGQRVPWNPLDGLAIGGLGTLVALLATGFIAWRHKGMRLPDIPAIILVIGFVGAPTLQAAITLLPKILANRVSDSTVPLAAFIVGGIVGVALLHINEK